VAQKHLTDLISQKVAETAVVASAGGFAITVADIDHYVSIAAGIAAIISASAAAYYYIAKTRREENGGAKPKDS
jgi:hypothetical protein